MENRPDEFEPPFRDSDKSMAQVNENLEKQIKPAAQWFKHIDHILNEVDDTVSALISPGKELINRKLYNQLFRLSNDLQPSSQQVPEGLPPTIEQFQDLASTAQKEVYELKSHLLNDMPATNSTLP